MRAAPAFQVSLQRFGAWRLAVRALLVAGWAGGAAWFLTHESPAPAWLALAVLLPAAWGWFLVKSLLRTPPTELRWDGQVWWLGHPDRPPVAGRLSVAVDLGPWMLLRFVPTRSATRSVRWLPVQRRGLESDWHALRCAVYSPVPAPPAAAHADSPRDSPPAGQGG